MSKAKDQPSPLSVIFSANLYKKNQGRIVRQVTAIVIVLITALGAWSLSQGPLGETTQYVRVGVPLGVLAAGAWIAFRAVNFPRFADFLISVEAEMDKVAWPSRSELTRAAIVVIVVMFLMAATLFLYDIIWKAVFEAIGFLRHMDS